MHKKYVPCCYIVAIDEPSKCSGREMEGVGVHFREWPASEVASTLRCKVLHLDLARQALQIYLFYVVTNTGHCMWKSLAKSILIQLFKDNNNIYKLRNANKLIYINQVNTMSHVRQLLTLFLCVCSGLHIPFGNLPPQHIIKLNGTACVQTWLKNHDQPCTLVLVHTPVPWSVWGLLRSTLQRNAKMHQEYRLCRGLRENRYFYQWYICRLII